MVRDCVIVALSFAGVMFWFFLGYLLGRRDGKEKPRVEFTIGPITKKGTVMKVVLTDEQQVPLAVGFKTAAGNPARVDGAPRWETSSTDVVELRPADDGLSCLVRSRGLGIAQVSVIADADLGEGVRPVTGVLDVEVQPAEAVSAAIVPGTPELKTETVQA